MIFAFKLPGSVGSNLMSMTIDWLERARLVWLVMRQECSDGASCIEISLSLLQIGPTNIACEDGEFATQQAHPRDACQHLR